MIIWSRHWGVPYRMDYHNEHNHTSNPQYWPDYPFHFHLNEKTR